jgi:alginate O-acetyltransferase complex protein AlgI
LRPRELLPQLHHPIAAHNARFVLGVLLYTLGLVKKTIFADQMAEVVDTIYAPGSHTALEYLITIYGFSLQIYNDFSGYTDMALGLALIIGVRLPNNFRRPYLAASIPEFWRRWHITLSYWLRDYIYILLGGNRNGRVRQFRNIMLTMAIGGLWHGANWTFVLWGVLHGLFIGLSHQLSHVGAGRALAKATPRWVAVVVTFHIVSLLWIPFRAPDMATAWRIASGPFVAPLGDISHTLSIYAWPLALLVVFALMHRFDRHATVRFLRMRLKPIILWSIVAILWLTVIAISTGSSAKFIYFDF